MSDLLNPTPPVHPETEPFWEATADGRLLIRQCRDCDEFHHYPRARCPHCFGADVIWVQASGTGTVYTHTVVRRTRGEYADATPYVLAYVELEEGPRMMTHIVDCDPSAISIGQEVAVTFTGGDEYEIPRFAPVDERGP
ncbi:Zn-ribbon domain-containing OB-fold protein [Halobellus salinisoli]|uniref:Zn-ribbon domain-containing OB-fold protein n=1 Tax=Halobellus salinisoli TaxID=3108500 RepID=UPI003009744C